MLYPDWLVYVLTETKMTIALFVVSLYTNEKLKKREERGTECLLASSTTRKVKEQNLH